MPRNDDVCEISLLDIMTFFYLVKKEKKFFESFKERPPR